MRRSRGPRRCEPRPPMLRRRAGTGPRRGTRPRTARQAGPDQGVAQPAGGRRRPSAARRLIGNGSIDRVVRVFGSATRGWHPPRLPPAAGAACTHSDGIGSAAPCRVNLARSLPRQSECRPRRRSAASPALAGRRGGRPADRRAGDLLSRGRSGRRSDFLPDRAPFEIETWRGRAGPHRPSPRPGRREAARAGRRGRRGWVRSPDPHDRVGDPAAGPLAASAHGRAPARRRPFLLEDLRWISCMK